MNGLHIKTEFLANLHHPSDQNPSHFQSDACARWGFVQKLGQDVARSFLVHKFYVRTDGWQIFLDLD